jgi:PucR family transcriptional regulator, purine catabolism regulatory protein
MGEPRFTLGDLLAEERFALRMQVAPLGWERRELLGAHGTEVEHPVRWLESDWAILTTGMRLRRKPDAQRELVREVKEGGLAALGFGTGLSFDQVPPAVIEEARECALPVFEIPLSTPFNEVCAFASRARVHTDFLVLRRLVSMQNYLMDSLQAASPEEEIVRRLGSSFDGLVALFLANGQLESLYRKQQQPTPTAPDEAWAREVWHELQAREPSFQRFTMGDTMVVSTPVSVNERVRYWLVAATRHRDMADALARSVLEAAGRVLAVVVTARRITTAQERAERGQLLETLLDPSAPIDDVLRQRVAALGVDLTTPARGVVIQARAEAGTPLPDSSATASPMRRLEQLCDGWHAAYLAAEREDGVYALVQTPVEQLGDGVRELCVQSGAIAGIGRSASSPEQLRVTLSDARLALRRLRQRGRHGPCLRFENFDIAGWLLSESSSEHVSEKANDMIGALLDKPVLYETLRSYMSHDMDVGRTARALALHPNSLRYRLAKIEELLGDSLHRPATIANLYLAMMVEADLGGGVAGGGVAGGAGAIGSSGGSSAAAGAAGSPNAGATGGSGGSSGGAASAA